jgi:hypothetical protein
MSASPARGVTPLPGAEWISIRNLVQQMSFWMIRSGKSYSRKLKKGREVSLGGSSLQCNRFGKGVRERICRPRLNPVVRCGEFGYGVPAEKTGGDRLQGALPCVRRAGAGDIGQQGRSPREVDSTATASRLISETRRSLPVVAMIGLTALERSAQIPGTSMRAPRSSMVKW